MQDLSGDLGKESRAENIDSAEIRDRLTWIVHAFTSSAPDVKKY
jgi:hypothetical protein